MNLYLDSINNASSEMQIQYLFGEIHYHEEFIKLYQNGMSNTQDLIEIQKCQDNINFCHEDLIKMNNIIKSIHKSHQYIEF
jgi:hypothetical protein